MDPSIDELPVVKLFGVGGSIDCINAVYLKLEPVISSTSKVFVVVDCFAMIDFLYNYGELSGKYYVGDIECKFMSFEATKKIFKFAFASLKIDGDQICDTSFDFADCQKIICRDFNCCGENFSLDPFCQVAKSVGCERLYDSVLRDLVRFLDNGCICIACNELWIEISNRNRMDHNFAIFLPEIRFSIIASSELHLNQKEPCQQPPHNFQSTIDLKNDFDLLFSSKQRDQYLNPGDWQSIEFSKEIFCRPNSCASLFGVGFCPESWIQSLRDRMSPYTIWYLVKYASEFGAKFNKQTSLVPTKSTIDRELNKAFQGWVMRRMSADIGEIIRRELLLIFSSITSGFDAYREHLIQDLDLISKNIFEYITLFSNNWRVLIPVEVAQNSAPSIVSKIGPLLDIHGALVLCGITTQILPSDKDISDHSVSGSMAVDSYIAQEQFGANVSLELLKVNSTFLMKRRYYNGAEEGGFIVDAFIKIKKVAEGFLF